MSDRKVIETTIDGKPVHVNVHEHEDGTVSATSRGPNAFAPLPDGNWLVIDRHDLSHNAAKYILKDDGTIRALTGAEVQEYTLSRTIADPNKGWDDAEAERQAAADKAEEDNKRADELEAKAKENGAFEPGAVAVPDTADQVEEEGAANEPLDETEDHPHKFVEDHVEPVDHGKPFVATTENSGPPTRGGAPLTPSGFRYRADESSEEDGDVTD